MKRGRWRADIDVDTGVTKRVLRLRRETAESSQLRNLSGNPDLNAVQIERQRRIIVRGMWFFLVLGLAFTTTGVHEFVASGRDVTDVVWWAGWLVEPMMAGVLINLLRFEAEIIARGVSVGSQWVSRLKRTLLVATLFMNTWPQVRSIGRSTFDLGMLVVHALVPVIVFLVAEVMPVVHRAMREALDLAYRAAAPAAQEQVSSGAATEAQRSVMARLPQAMRDVITQKAREVAAAGRELTPDDVRQAVRLPVEMANQIAIAFETP